MLKQPPYISYNFEKKEYNRKTYHGVEFYKDNENYMSLVKAKFESWYPMLELVELRSMQTKEKLPDMNRWDPYKKQPKASKEGKSSAFQLVYRSRPGRCRGDEETGEELAGSWVFFKTFASASDCADFCARHCSHCVLSGSNSSCTRGAVLVPACAGAKGAQADNSYNPVEPPVAKDMGGRPKGGGGDKSPAKLDRVEVPSDKMAVVFKNGNLEIPFPDECKDCDDDCVEDGKIICEKSPYAKALAAVSALQMSAFQRVKE